MYKHKCFSFSSLVLTTLLLFPGVAKSLHTHNYQHLSCNESGIPGFNHQNESCLVCDFEFVSFIGEDTQAIRFKTPAIYILNEYLSADPEFTGFFYYSLRAPPAWQI
jgi:hypothetical protein